MSIHAVKARKQAAIKAGVVKPAFQVHWKPARGRGLLSTCIFILDCPIGFEFQQLRPRMCGVRLCKYKHEARTTFHVCLLALNKAFLNK